MANGFGNGDGWTLTPKMVMGWTLTIQVIINTVVFWGFESVTQQINDGSKDRYHGKDAEADKELFEEKLNGIEFRFVRNEAKIQECLIFARRHAESNKHEKQN